jgi:hypothetical protein
MEHCAASYVSDVLSGDYEFFRWAGKERMTVAIKRRFDGTWKLDQISGFQNETPSKETTEEITLLINDKTPNHCESNIVDYMYFALSLNWCAYNSNLLITKHVLVIYHDTMRTIVAMKSVS